MHQTTELLLPCPFCGGKATLGRDILDPHLCWQVVCANLDCAATIRRLPQQEMAIQLWNTRTQVAQIDIRS